jgi:hypothetical protein
MKFIIGPELFWIILYIAAILLGRVNQSMNNSLDDFIETLWFWIPVLSSIVFYSWKISIIEKKYLLTRVWIAGIVGGHLVIEKALHAYSEQGPGIGMGYLAGMMLLLLILALGTIIVKLFFSKSS